MNFSFFSTNRAISIMSLVVHFSIFLGYIAVLPYPFFYSCFATIILFCYGVPAPAFLPESKGLVVVQCYFVRHISSPYKKLITVPPPLDKNGKNYFMFIPLFLSTCCNLIDGATRHFQAIPTSAFAIDTIMGFAP